MLPPAMVCNPGVPTFFFAASNIQEKLTSQVINWQPLTLGEISFSHSAFACDASLANSTSQASRTRRNTDMAVMPELPRAKGWQFNLIQCQVLSWRLGRKRGLPQQQIHCDWGGLSYGGITELPSLHCHLHISAPRTLWGSTAWDHHETRKPASPAHVKASNLCFCLSYRCFTVFWSLYLFFGNTKHDGISSQKSRSQNTRRIFCFRRSDLLDPDNLVVDSDDMIQHPEKRKFKPKGV